MSDERSPDTRPTDDQLEVAWPPPAAHEVAKTGSPLLPGMEDVPERPADPRYPR